MLTLYPEQKGRPIRRPFNVIPLHFIGEPLVAVAVASVPVVFAFAVDLAVNGPAGSGTADFDTADQQHRLTACPGLTLFPRSVRRRRPSGRVDSAAVRPRLCCSRRDR